MTTVTDLGQEASVPKKFIVRRNQSLSWQGNKIFILFVGILCFAIAIGFASQGLWLILPFAGLEIFALTAGLYLCCLRNRQQEVITIENDKLLVEKGEKGPTKNWQFERAWVSLVLHQSKYRGHPDRLIIRSKGKELEIGECLTSKEKRSLADTIVKALPTTLLKS